MLRKQIFISLFLLPKRLYQLYLLLLVFFKVVCPLEMILFLEDSSCVWLPFSLQLIEKCTETSRLIIHNVKFRNLASPTKQIHKHCPSNENTTLRLSKLERSFTHFECQYRFPAPSRWHLKTRSSHSIDPQISITHVLQLCASGVQTMSACKWTSRAAQGVAGLSISVFKIFHNRCP